jgi:flagellin-like hook-associated protein FlgL
VSDDNKNLPSEINDVYSKLGKIVSNLPKINTSLDPKSGMSLIQKSQLAINQIAELLSGMRVLAEKAASGTLSSSELGNTIQEYQALHREIDRIAHDTSYSNVQLLDGSLGPVTIANDGLELIIQVNNFTTEALGLNSNNINLYNINDAQQALHAIKNAIETVNITLNSLETDEITLQKLMHDSEYVQTCSSFSFCFTRSYSGCIKTPLG